MSAPALPLCVAFVAGIVSAFCTGLSPFSGFFVAAIALAGGCLCVSRRSLALGTLLSHLAMLGLGLSAGAVHEQRMTRSELRAVFERLGPDAFDEPHRVRARLLREPESRSDASVLRLDVESVFVGGRELTAPGGLLASVHGERREALTSLAAGDRVRLWVRLSKPSSFRNPGGFDREQYLARQHIDLVGSVKSGLLVDLEASEFQLPTVVSNLRRVTHRRLAAELDAPEIRGVVRALVTGDRAELSPDLERTYQRAGIFHVMAISGAHVAIWIAFVYASLRIVGVGTRKSLVILLLALPCYAAFCGGRPPVVRAVIMSLVVIGARFRSITAPPTNILALAIVAILAWEPGDLLDAGFQLTVSAMTTIVVFYDQLAARLSPLGMFSKPLAVSIAAQLGVVPVAAWHFHRLTLIAPAASVVAVPIAAMVCLLGATLVLVSGVPVLASAVAWLVELAVSFLTGVAELSAELPFASIRLGAPHPVTIAAYVVALGLLLAPRARWRCGGALILVGLFALAVRPVRVGDGTLVISALDVGHGDAIFISLPHGGAVLVDGGGVPVSSFDIGERVVLPFLLDSGVRRLDAIVVSHADYDHIGGLATIVDELRVDAIWRGNVDRLRPAYRELEARAADRNVPVRRLVTGELLELEGVLFEVLAAGDLGERNVDASNDRSLVLRVSFAGRSVLLTGDAEDPLERLLMRSGAELRADVLKLAHHGSKTSTSAAFLDAVDPRFAIVSARRSRARPLPADEVLERLDASGIDYARTDESGTITVRIHPDGNVETTTLR